jgi:Uma2 family endonuclease
LRCLFINLQFDGKPQLNDDRLDEVLNPILIVEVLSPSTADCDRQSKFRMYRSIPSFSEYLLVEQDEPFVERYSKQAEGWLLSDFSSLEVSISLDSVAIALSYYDRYVLVLTDHLKVLIKVNF